MTVFSLIPVCLSLYLFFIEHKTLEKIVLDLPRVILAILPMYLPALWLAVVSHLKSKLSKRLIEFINFIVDKSKNKLEIKEFNNYIKKNLESRIDPVLPFEIEHENSQEDVCLSAVDLFAWGIFRKYENKDLAWYSCFKKHLKYDKLYETLR